MCDGIMSWTVFFFVGRVRQPVKSRGLYSLQWWTQLELSYLKAAQNSAASSDTKHLSVKTSCPASDPPLLPREQSYLKRQQLGEAAHSLKSATQDGCHFPEGRVTSFVDSGRTQDSHKPMSRHGNLGPDRLSTVPRGCPHEL